MLQPLQLLATRAFVYEPKKDDQKRCFELHSRDKRLSKVEKEKMMIGTNDYNTVRLVSVDWNS
jgi:hypothetical protein